MIGSDHDVFYIKDESDKVFAYVRKGAEPVIKQPHIIHRLLKFIGLGRWAKKPVVEWVGGTYVRDEDNDIFLD